MAEATDVVHMAVGTRIGPRRAAMCTITVALVLSASVPTFAAITRVRAPAHAGETARVHVLYSFRGGQQDGALPEASVTIDPSGSVFGTTQGGGPNDSGTVFALQPSGSGYVEHVLYAFRGERRGQNEDGAYPVAPVVIDAAGDLYGTTSGGGIRNCAEYFAPGAKCGTVFALIRNKTRYSERVLYAFEGGNTDGSVPMAGLFLDASGDLYGTTSDFGPAYAFGDVFKLTPSPSSYAESFVTVFAYDASGPPFFVGGAGPAAPVIADAGGSLYGTTEYGGTAANPPCLGAMNNFGCGVVFKLTTSPSGYIETVLHSFQDGNDGAFPLSGLVADGSGALYGTTQYGGPSNLGTVFKLTPSGTGYEETVLYAFVGGADGALPVAGLSIDGSGALYGTTPAGGVSNLGTIFKLTPSGSTYEETILHSFTGGADGAEPYAGLVASSPGALYGTTSRGGKADAGTVFKLTL